MPDETPVPFADVCEAVGAELAACPCQCHDAHCVPCRDQAWWAAALRALAALLEEAEALATTHPEAKGRTKRAWALIFSLARGYVPPTKEEG